MPNFKFSPAQKAFKEQLNEQGQEMFDGIVNSLIEADSLEVFIEEVGSEYKLDATKAPVEVLHGLFLQLDWTDEDAGGNKDYEEFCKTLTVKKSSAEKKADKKAGGEKKKAAPRGASKVTEEVNKDIITATVKILKANKKPVIIADLKAKVAEKVKNVSTLKIYKTITGYGKGEFKVDDMPKLVIGNESNKRTYTLDN